MWSSIETAERIGLVLAQELPSAYRTLCYKEIWVPPKLRDRQALPTAR